MPDTVSLAPMSGSLPADASTPPAAVPSPAWAGPTAAGQAAFSPFATTGVVPPPVVPPKPELVEGEVALPVAAILAGAGLIGWLLRQLV